MGLRSLSVFVVLVVEGCTSAGLVLITQLKVVVVDEVRLWRVRGRTEQHLAAKRVTGLINEELHTWEDTVCEDIVREDSV